MTTRLKMPLYTVILDYVGGTHVSQLTGSSEQEALQEWTAKLFKHLLAGYVSDEVAEVYRRGAHLVPLDGLNGVWCGSEDGAQGFALVNIVRTEP